MRVLFLSNTNLDAPAQPLSSGQRPPLLNGRRSPNCCTNANCTMSTILHYQPTTLTARSQRPPGQNREILTANQESVILEAAAFSLAKTHLVSICKTDHRTVSHRGTINAQPSKQTNAATSLRAVSASPSTRRASNTVKAGEL